MINTITIILFIFNTQWDFYIDDLGEAREFKRQFETPILRGRDADATVGEHQKGKEKLLEVV